MASTTKSRLGRLSHLQPGLNFSLLILLMLAASIGLLWLRQGNIDSVYLSEIFTLGTIGLWRWSWFGLQTVRSRLYEHVLFPRMRRRANAIPTEKLPPVCLLVPTYKEKAWISERVFRMIAQEAQTLPYPITLLVTSGSEAENVAIRAVLEATDPGLQHIRLIQMVQTGEGKRKAMADGLRVLAQQHLPANTIVALMDGDSELTPGTLRRCLPFFCLYPNLGALTTDELPDVHGSFWFSEWFHLRMAQRHHHMCAVAPSHKVTCLTGRFSLFRSEATFHPGFINQLENDMLEDWLWGKFKFLSGDDKSTWYWLLKHQYDMLYIPDVIVYSIETITGSLWQRAYQNMRRWYGNMLRNSGRAIALGPQKTGWFIWFVLIDQKISIWTPLLTPGFLLLCLIQGRWLAAAIIGCWLMLTRPLALMIYFIHFKQRASHLKPLHFPLLLISQWAACLVKIWTQTNLAQQRWSNRGNQKISAEGKGMGRIIKLGTARFLYLSGLAGFLVVLSSLSGSIHPLNDATQAWWSQQVNRQQETIVTIESINYGVIPNDDADDAFAITQLIRSLPRQGKIQITLPPGKLELRQPIEINRSHTILRGAGIDRTILQAYLVPTPEVALIKLQPEPASVKLAVSKDSLASSGQSVNHSASSVLQAVELSGFTLRQRAPNHQPQARVNGIFLQQAEQIALRHLRFEQGIRTAIEQRSSRQVTVEYVADEQNQTPDYSAMLEAPSENPES
jgi:glycosyltransferase Alg8